MTNMGQRPSKISCYKMVKRCFHAIYTKWTDPFKVSNHFNSIHWSGNFLVFWGGFCLPLQDLVVIFLHFICSRNICLHYEIEIAWNLIFYTRKPWLLLVFRQNKRFIFFLSTNQYNQKNSIKSLLWTIYLKYHSETN